MADSTPSSSTAAQAEPPRGPTSLADTAKSAQESRGAAPVVCAVVGVQGALIGWWCWFVLRDEGLADALSGPQGRALLAILGLLSLAASILEMTQAERWAERSLLNGSHPTVNTQTVFRRADLPRGRRILAYAVMMHFVAAILALTVYVFWPGEPFARQFGLAGVVIVGLILSVAVMTLYRDSDSGDDSDTGDVAASEQEEADSGSLAASEQEEADTGDENCADPGLNGLTIAMSGGGIRAAAFALGSYNALAQSQIPTVDQGAEPRLVAVSGGSYMAAAIALLRSFNGTTGEVVDKPPFVSWQSAYGIDTPELKRLRRHTRDLVEPFKDLVGGLLSLISGAALNLVMVLGLTALAAWVLAWLYETAGILTIETAAENGSLQLRLMSFFTADPSGQTRDARVAILVPLLVLGIGFVLMSLLIYGQQQGEDIARAKDQDEARAKGRDIHPKSSNPGQKLVGARSGIVVALIGWSLAMVAVPAVIYALSQLSLSNAPTRQVASALDALGFTTDRLCENAAETSVGAAHEEASAHAGLDPGTVHGVAAGSCGNSVVVSAQVPPVEGGELTQAKRMALYNQAAGVESATGGTSFPARLTAAIALISTAGVFLRRFSVNPDAPLTGWRARIRRLLMAWLPLTIAVLLLLWFFLSRVFIKATDVSQLAALGSAVPIMIALLVAAWTDANTTSLHSFYRQRLSSAFAVGRLEDGRAAQLPYNQAYKFSELRRGGLHVVTTANVRAYDEVPTRRGGIPLVLSPEGVRMVTADGGEVSCDAPTYEKAAGPGRVSVMAAVATSGAAVSPMAGRFAATIAPFRVLMTVFNVRVGSWVLNPAWVNSRVHQRGRSPCDVLLHWPATPWLIGRPGAAQVLVEAAGRSSVEDRWLYLSDGGHLDNTGLVEAVRLHRVGDRYTGNILVVDASNDALGSWSAVGDAMAVVLAELGVEFECKLGVPVQDEGQRPGTPTPAGSGSLVAFLQKLWPPPQAEPKAQPYMRLYRGLGDDTTLEVMVVKAVRPSAEEDIPESVRSFSLLNPQFPRASTTRQDFGDLEFEAYRALGDYYASKALDRWEQHADAERVGHGAH